MIFITIKFLSLVNSKLQLAKNIKSIIENLIIKESQCAIEAFNNIYQDYHSDCYEIIDLRYLIDLLLTVFKLFNFYNQKRKHNTTNRILSEVFRKYDDQTVHKEVVMATEQSRAKYLTQIYFEKREQVVVTNLLY